MADTADPSAAIARDYVARAERFGATERSLNALASRLSQLRLAAFVAAIATAGVGLGGNAPAVVVMGGVAVAVIAYILAARRHRAVHRDAVWAGVRRLVCEQGARRIARDWNGMRVDAAMEPAARDHAYAADLDITGHASLARLLAVTSAGPGRRTVLDWLLGPVPATGEIRARQQAVRELIAGTDWRETLTGHGWMTGSQRRTDVERFLAWARREPWLLQRPWMSWSARVLPFVIVPAVLLATSSVMWERGVGTPSSPGVIALGAFARAWWAVPFVAGLILSFAARRALGQRIQDAIAHLGGLDAYGSMLAHVQASAFSAPRLRVLRDRLSTGQGAANELRRLGGIVRLAEARYSPMAHVALQVLGLWDFHVLAALEAWQRTSGAHAGDWLAALGDAEALGALATLAFDNPDWTFPELLEHGDRIAGVAVGHPLLPASTRVANDIVVGPAGTFVLVTGSNMSGKSTLLRAIGANVVLAQAGGPVCASRLTLGPVDLWTSIRIDDSLEAGVSLFMAELRRLKRIVDAARASDRPRPLLYLLDEMLHGTNTAERRIAARRVLALLLRAGAIGAVTTHDLTLAEDPSLDAHAQRVHFTEHFERRDGAMTMTFDYRLRPGLATSANALKLLAMIGLDDDAASVSGPA